MLIFDFCHRYPGGRLKWTAKVGGLWVYSRRSDQDFLGYLCNALIINKNFDPV
jgi:hypothetical protein